MGTWSLHQNKTLNVFDNRKNFDISQVQNKVEHAATIVRRTHTRARTHTHTPTHMRTHARPHTHTHTDSAPDLQP